MSNKKFIFLSITLSFAIFIIITGCMSIKCNTTDNFESLIMGLFTVFLAACLMVLLIPIHSNLLIMLAIIFGICNGMLTIVNAFEEQISVKRIELNMYVGSSTIIVGVINTAWALISLLKELQIKPFTLI